MTSKRLEASGHRTWLAHSLLLISTCVLSSTAAADHDACSISTLTTGGAGSRGNITSPSYPQPMPEQHWSKPNCRLFITSCPACRMRITYDDFVGPSCHVTRIPLGSCVPQCDHLMLFEPDYPEQTIQYIFFDSTLTSYTTTSNRVKLVVCFSSRSALPEKKFRLGFEVQEKKRVIRGRADDRSSGGVFTSPNFPHGYSLHNEVYTFLLENADPKGLVRLGFDDWILSPNSRITVYFHNETHPDGYLTRMGRGERPFVLSSGPSLFIKFETGEDLYSIPYIGFKARYEFVSEPYWPEKPYTVHDEYFYSRYGGEFSFDTRRCWPRDRVDSIWVITKYNDRNHDQVALSIQSLYIVPDVDYLEIRSGNSSDGILLGNYDHTNLTDMQFISPYGFYVRLRVTCDNSRHFHAIFTSFTNATAGACSYYNHLKCANNRCIAKTLHCDGIDHCGDGSDETNCTPPDPYDKKECISSKLCDDGQGWYCQADRCNDHNDCDDGTDERNCWTTNHPWTVSPGLADSYYKLGMFVPIGLVAALVAIVACILISCCARRKRNMLLRRQMANQGGGRSLPSISANLPTLGRRQRTGSGTHLNINVEIQHYPDSPPPYEEAISQSASTYSGIHNMGFSMSDSSDQLMPPPPPYTITDENPHPPSAPPPSTAPPAARGLYMSAPSRGLIIGMPCPSDAYPPPTSRSSDHQQVAIAGSGDLAGSADLPQVHGSRGATSHRSRDPGRRRAPTASPPSSGAAGGTGRAPPADRRQRPRRGGSTADPNHRNSSSRRQHGETASRPPPPPPPQPPQSATGAEVAEGTLHDESLPPPPPPPRLPLRNFIQNILSRAARQTSAEQAFSARPALGGGSSSNSQELGPVRRERDVEPARVTSEGGLRPAAGQSPADGRVGDAVPADRLVQDTEPAPDENRPPAAAGKETRQAMEPPYVHRSCSLDLVHSPEHTDLDKGPAAAEEQLKEGRSAAKFSSDGSDTNSDAAQDTPAPKERVSLDGADNSMTFV